MVSLRSCAVSTSAPVSISTHVSLNPTPVVPGKRNEIGE